jgi:flagellar biosynthetic protein FliR
MIDYSSILARVPVFVLVFFRLAGMMLFAPLFGSAQVPKRVRVLLVLVLAMGICPSVKAVALPETGWQLALGIGGEMAFGLAMGMLISFVFIAAQWAGEMVGQQMGFNIGQTFNPQYGGGGSVMGDLYFWLTLVIFLAVGGQYAMLRGVRDSFDKLPLLSLSVDQSLFDLMVGLFQSATILALRLASPVLVTMLAVDLSLGLVGRTLPQFNVMQSGMSVRSMIGLLVIIAGLVLTGQVIESALHDSIDTVRARWVTPSSVR